ncbi:EAL domain-containing protein [Sutcliffiella halmapala]|uniref:EAL domain-containing protein n=1 Tax=Sutcliffiella halmapala TaxID=79882 RepID=UPI000994B1EE|nr:EAL domain-containing protein [Sutcliffiella halmapala]
MDPLDIMTNLERVIPYYQAIFSADRQEVIGYEVLGRIQMETADVHSLGAFFHDTSIPDEYRLEVEKVILNQALTAFIEEKSGLLLFINQNAQLLLVDQGESLLELLLSYVPKGLKLENIVLELDEHAYIGDIENLQHLISYYRTFGIQIAVSNIGEAGSNLDRIGRLSPNILKVDLQILRQSHEVSTHQDVLFSLAVLSRKIGATLLYENIEASYQLQYAWRHGGRYYQGFYLHRPGPTFIPEDYGKSVLIEKFQQFIRYEKRKLEAIQQLTEMLQDKIQQLISKHKKMEELDLWLQLIAKEFSDISFRMYICDENGFQLSANLMKENGNWKVKPEYKMKNWSWRPYFLEYVMKMRVERKGLLSDIYSDIESGESVRTFSFPISPNRYLYIDLAYDFLYENQDFL